MNTTQNYALFHKFIETYSPIAFNGIHPNDPLILELEGIMEKNNQFIIVADLLQMKVLFTSKQCTEILGIAPTEITPNLFFSITHPDDFERFSLGRIKLFKLAQNFFMSKEGNALTSTNLRIRNPQNKYNSLLFQCYLFYSSAPIETVYCLNIYTNIDGFKKIRKQYHYYSGNDLSYFRYPDEKLLQTGTIYTKREFEIIKLIELGLNTEQIADKLFVSPNTVNVHRGNILKKSGKTRLSELIYDLMEQGML